MDSVARAALSSWSWRPEVFFPLLLLAGLFANGWLRLRSRSPRTGRRSLGAPWRLVSYIAGLVVIGVALMSPLDVLVQQLFFMHMIQHLLLIMIAPPLLLLPNPMPFLMWGLPARMRLVVGEVTNTMIRKTSMAGRFLRAASGPAVVWFLVIGIIVGWHDPALYDAALRSELVHDFEHVTMFFAGMLYWWVVSGAGPRLNRQLSRIAKVVFVLAAVPPTMALGIVLSFSPEPIYSFYRDMPRLWGISVMDDQRISGIIMWIPGGMMHFMTALAIIFLILTGEGRKPAQKEAAWNDEAALAAPGVAVDGGRS